MKLNLGVNGFKLLGYGVLRDDVFVCLAIEQLLKQFPNRKKKNKVEFLSCSLMEVSLDAPLTGSI
jgi:hypothetical protein